MTLNELMQALKELVERDVDPEEPIVLEICGTAFEPVSITVVVQSDLWEPGTVVITGDPMDDGEADDG
jgi:hypothetical protein